MLYAVLFQDNDEKAAMRTRYMAEHLAFLERNSGQIRAAGPLADTQDSTPAGGLWLVEAPDVQDVRGLIEADPFWPTGLRKSVRVLSWAQVFADGKRQI